MKIKDNLAFNLYIYTFVKSVYIYIFFEWYNVYIHICFIYKHTHIFLNGTLSVTHWIMELTEICDIYQETKLHQCDFAFIWRKENN